MCGGRKDRPSEMRSGKRRTAKRGVACCEERHVRRRTVREKQPERSRRVVMTSPIGIASGTWKECAGTCAGRSTRAVDVGVATARAIMRLGPGESRSRLARRRARREQGVSVQRQTNTRQVRSCRLRSWRKAFSRMVAATSPAARRMCPPTRAQPAATRLTTSAILQLARARSMRLATSATRPTTNVRM